MEFCEKQKNLHLKQLDTVIVEIRLPMGYSPGWEKNLKIKITKLTKPTSTLG